MSFHLRVRVRNDPGRYKRGEDPASSLLLALQDLLEGKDERKATSWLQENVNSFSGERSGEEAT